MHAQRQFYEVVAFSFYESMSGLCCAFLSFHILLFKKNKHPLFQENMSKPIPERRKQFWILTGQEIMGCLLFHYGTI